VLLVVEDNAVAREGLAAVLRQGGYEVLTARDGQEALDRLRAGLVPDLILLDMLMDGVDGWRFLAALQHWPQRPSVPIIITTGTILTREWAEQNGCQGFLNKPIEVDALFEEVERCLGHTR
jgi:CheY-like chemotaxis protein